MLFLLLDMAWKMESHTGLSRTHGVQVGVTMDSSKWRGGKTCVVSLIAEAVDNII